MAVEVLGAVDRHCKGIMSNCKQIIPDTFIACGEEGLYCSDECLLRAEVERLTRERDAFMRDAAHEMQVSRELHAECERLRKVLEVLCVDRDVPAWVQDYAAASLEQRTNNPKGTGGVSST